MTFQKSDVGVIPVSGEQKMMTEMQLLEKLFPSFLLSFSLRGIFSITY
jgi:hypothetical protein